ncbi:hypothetical protein FXO38_35131 [Capsicum annuum]|nr:hypothetical protein FXO38_35131 [Capsicum annuum]KAF3619795.1 hypothetical protein FXO37_33530 [Capsicum annuum]
MTKAPSKVCSNPSNLVFNDPALKVESCVLEKVRGNLVLLIRGFGFAILIVNSGREVKLRDKDGEVLADLSGNASSDVNLGDSFCALVSVLRSWSGFGGEEEAELVTFF